MSIPSDLNSSQIPKLVLNPTPISFAPPSSPVRTAVEPLVPPQAGTSGTATPSTKKGKRKGTDGTATPSTKKGKIKTNIQPSVPQVETSGTGSPSTKKSDKEKKSTEKDEPQSVSSETKRPDFLPQDWEIKEFTRKGGKMAGSKYKYYIEPGTNQVFRSMVEVRRHLGLSGTPKKPKLDHNKNIEIEHAVEATVIGKVVEEKIKPEEDGGDGATVNGEVVDKIKPQQDGDDEVTAIGEAEEKIKPQQDGGDEATVNGEVEEKIEPQEDGGDEVTVNGEVDEKIKPEEDGDEATVNGEAEEKIKPKEEN